MLLYIGVAILGTIGFLWGVKTGKTVANLAMAELVKEGKMVVVRPNEKVIKIPMAIWEKRHEIEQIGKNIDKYV